jgi:outer membrane protein
MKQGRSLLKVYGGRLKSLPQLREVSLRTLKNKESAQADLAPLWQRLQSPATMLLPALRRIATISLGVCFTLGAGVPGETQERAGTPTSGVASTGAVAPAQPLTLRQALDIALNHNRLIDISRLQVDQARQRVAQSRTGLLPQFNVDVQGGELLDTVYVHFPAGFLGTVDGSLVPSHALNIPTKDHFSTVYTLTVAQPITQIPRIRTGIRLQRIGEEIATEQERQQRISITAGVRQTYFALLQIQEGIRATNVSLKALQELERSIADSVAQQAALRADLLEVQAHVAAQEATLSTQLDTLQQYKEQMNLLLGRDVQTPFQLVAEADDPLPDVRENPSPTLQERPDLKRSLLQIRQAQLDRHLTQLDYIPDFSLAMRYAAIATGINALPDHLWTAGFQFTWKEPWDWGRRRHEIAEKNKQIEQAQLAYEEAKSAAQLDLNNQIRREHAARDELNAAEAAQTAARERLRVTMDQYQVKEALLKDVLQAQSALAVADRQVQDAGLAYRIAQSELRRARGEE